MGKLLNECWIAKCQVLWMPVFELFWEAERTVLWCRFTSYNVLVQVVEEEVSKEVNWNLINLAALP
jgi:hypothetical protein